MKRTIIATVNWFCPIYVAVLMPVIVFGPYYIDMESEVPVMPTSLFVMIGIPFLLSCLTTVVILFSYLIDVINNPEVHPLGKTAWGFYFIFLSGIAIPTYWAKYIRKRTEEAV